MGELFEVLGWLRFSNFEPCPSELRGKTIKLKPAEGDVFEVPAESACISASVRRVAVQRGIDEAISLPLKKATMVKVIDYFKHHRDSPAGELITPLPSGDLVECGATRWDAKFVDVDKNMLFDLNLAASVLDIAGLFFLTSAKAAVLFRDKSADRLRKDFNLNNDLPKAEEDAMGRELKASGKAHLEDASAEIAALAVTLQAAAIAAEKQGCLEAARTDAGAPVVDLKSWRHATWRASVLLDWNLLSAAPREVQGDRDLMMAALMTSQGAALQYASAELRADKKVVLEATKYFGTAFKEASPELRGDRDFVLEAVAAHGAALGGASDALRGDRALVLEAAGKGHGSALQGATKELQRDAEFVLQVAAADPQAFRYAAEELREDRQFALRIAKHSGRTLQHMLPRFKADREVVTAAVGENVAAALFAHTSRRQDIGIPLPWDTQDQLTQDCLGAGVATEAPMPGGTRMMMPPDDVYYGRHKIQKSVQFSAMSTQMGNMGQANYVAANIYLDKLPAYQRPEVDAVTLMWGAVGNMGMRWKAFGSADVLNQVPEALLTINDAAKVLHATCTKMDPPEWYCATVMDIHSREGFLTITSGGGQGGGWKPSEDYSLALDWRAHGLEKGFLLGKDLEDERAQQDLPDSGVRDAPLGGWPGLLHLQGATAAPEPRPHYELEPGARVELVGLSSKNGATGILTKCFADGKWKVRLEDGSGNALLKACYLEAVAPATMVAKEEGTKGAVEHSATAPSAAELRRLKADGRSCLAKDRRAGRSQA